MVYVAIQDQGLRDAPGRSEDLLHWTPLGTVLPFRDEGRDWQPKAFDTFAASYDLVHWTKWRGTHLKAPSEPWDETYAHKPWLVKHEGVVYRFYCAVGSEGRVIALATSKDLGASD